MRLSDVKTYVSGVINALFPNRDVLSKLSDSNGMLTYDNNPVSLDRINYKTGSVIVYVGTSAPPGWLICDGSEVNISNYRNLSLYIKRQFGSVNYFGGDGTATFALPNYNTSGNNNGFTILIKI